jgi:predicted nucleic acid-binding protein
VIVVDLTVLGAYLLRTTGFASAVKVVERDPLWVLPNIWRMEFLEALVGEVRTGRWSLADAHTRIAAAEFIIRFSHEVIDDLEILSYASKSQLNAAEITYVLTARKLGTKLVTAKTQILRECADVAITPDQFGGS